MAISNSSIELRSSEIDNFEKLQEFQKYMKQLHRLESSGALLEAASIKPMFTIEEVASGTEFLLNLKYTKPSHRRAFKKSHFHEFRVPISSNGIDLFNAARANLLHYFNNVENNRLSSIITQNIDIIGQDNDEYIIGVTVIIGDFDRCILQNLVTPNIGSPCDNPFGEDESYYTGVWGFDRYPDITETYNANLDCLDKCGGIGPCNTITNIAFEQIQTHINNSIGESSCPPGYVWTGTHSNVQQGTYDFGFNTDSGVSTFTDFDCIDSGADVAGTACDCLDAEQLNCIYCGLNDIFINQNTNVPYVDIPVGYELIYMDIAVDFINIGDGDNYTTQPTIDYTYGIPVCVEELIDIGEDHVLDIDLGGFEGGN